MILCAAGTSLLPATSVTDACNCCAAESAATNSKPSFESKGDYYTTEEMAQFSKPKSQKVCAPMVSPIAFQHNQSCNA